MQLYVNTHLIIQTFKHLNTRIHLYTYTSIVDAGDVDGFVHITCSAFFGLGLLIMMMFTYKGEIIISIYKRDNTKNKTFYFYE
jgi:hypothetical protein